MSFLAFQYVFLVRQFVNLVESGSSAMSFFAFQYIFLVKQFANCVKSDRYDVLLGLQVYLAGQTVRQLRGTQQVYMSFLAFQYMHVLVGLPVYLPSQTVRQTRIILRVCPSWPFSTSS